VSANQDTTSALPGTALRFGMESSRFGAAQGFQPTSRQLPADRLERSGPMRFFGIDAEATLSFLERRLVQADFVIAKASPRQIAYIDDDLARRGYHRGCIVLERDRSQCTWLGPTRIELSRSGARITAVIRPRTREAPPAPLGEPAAGVADTSPVMPMHPDTLVMPPGWEPVDFLVGPAPTAGYPRAARDAGVQGVVRMLARVDTSGTVVDVKILRSIPELDSAAVATLRGMRFRPFMYEGRRVGGWVRVPVTFTLH